VKTQGGKNTEQREREIPLSQRDYKEFSTLYYKFNSLRFDLVQRRKRSAFIAEG